LPPSEEGVLLNLAVTTDVLALIVIVQVSVPEHLSPQPAKTEPESATAVSVTEVPDT
jgi:hypothetical protein